MIVYFRSEWQTLIALLTINDYQEDIDLDNLFDFSNALFSAVLNQLRNHNYGREDYVPHKILWPVQVEIPRHINTDDMYRLVEQVTHKLKRNFCNSWERMDVEYKWEGKDNDQPL